MRISIIGTGYVGLVTAACLADMGNDVIALDIDPQKIENLRQGIMPIYEPGLQALVERNSLAKRLVFTTHYHEAIAQTDIVFIAVGTPSEEDGSADLSHVLSAAKSIALAATKNLVIVDKSTVPVGTADRVLEVVKQEFAKRGVEFEVDVISNPEFLKEGSAINDFQRPERIIVGSSSATAIALMKQLYAPFSRTQDKLLVMDTRSAELSKYAANAMLATRISFMNELALLAESLGADIEQVRHGIGSDSRIGPHFLYAGIGFGGSCFPKDLRALIHMAQNHKIPHKVLDAVTAANEQQKTVLSAKIHAFFNHQLKNKTVAIWGLAFKPETDDMRDAPSIAIIKELVSQGAFIRAYDPIAAETAATALATVLGPQWRDQVCIVDNAMLAADGADVLALVTEWKEFRSPNFEALARLLRSRAVFDGRNQYDPTVVRAHGLRYEGIGRPHFGT
jgi:UDPglucose 6-dehydrogenase